MKRKRIFLIFLLIIMLAIIGLVIWQRENIKALYMGLTTSEESLEKKRIENDKIITDALNEYPELTVRDLTEEEKKLFAYDKLTKEEILLLLQGKLVLNNNDSASVVPEKTDTADSPQIEEPTIIETNPVDSNTPTATEPTETEPSTPAITPPPSTPKTEITPEDTEDAQPTADEQISELVAQMYILKAEFITALQELENTTLKAYAALSKEEKTPEVKSSMMTQVLDTVAAMEKDCDTRVNAVLVELTALLKENNKSLSLVDAIRTAYNNEKTITKAEYINTYFK